MTKSNQHLGASFRDPSGFLFLRNGLLYRQINHIYHENYQTLMDSGLYEELVHKHLLIPHEEVVLEAAESQQAYKIIQPELLQFISYPYEWCFSQLKDAALATLKIQKIAFNYRLSLKDCSAFNIQFHHGQPLLIDTLSFEIYQEGEPWVAYRQFCQHFLAPLALMAFRDVRLSALIRVHIDGIPLDLASHLLPIRTWFNFGLLSHIHLHAISQKRYADKTVDKSTITRRMSSTAFLGLVDSLETAVRGLRLKIQKTEWEDYYQEAHSYTSDGLQHKLQLVGEYIDRIQPNSLWDLGANVGLFSRLASDRGITTLSFDVDQNAVEQNYLASKEEGAADLLPLILDLTNPSPNLGWHNNERMSLFDRSSPDAVLALALVHHLAISNNVPLEWLADFFSSLGPWLVIELVPKSDPQVGRLLATREDIFPKYTQEGFELAFRERFDIQDATQIRDSERILYLMKKREDF
ncbi:MAG: hypothetical protein AMJ88_18245 [Anaerolineae bacterium SM23_ 63]|nr:MAG: hypothetical protein AMJ88_18245 [Anaerolineae bacterium SM23_ 63]